MPDKPDLAKLFGVEGLITPKSILTETKEDIDQKTANSMRHECSDLLNLMDEFIRNGDIVGVILCLDALSLRVDGMYSVAAEIRLMLGGYRNIPRLPDNSGDET